MDLGWDFQRDQGLTYKWKELTVRIFGGGRAFLWLWEVRGLFCKIASGALGWPGLGAICAVNHRSGGGRDRGPAVNPVHGSMVDRSKGGTPRFDQGRWSRDLRPGTHVSGAAGLSPGSPVCRRDWLDLGRCWRIWRLTSSAREGTAAGTLEGGGARRRVAGDAREVVSRPR
jgi:hypothetical protein